jgi:hypothetical protein
MYQIALENYALALRAWEARHPELAEERGDQASAD